MRHLTKLHSNGLLCAFVIHSGTGRKELFSPDNFSGFSSATHLKPKLIPSRFHNPRQREMKRSSKGERNGKSFSTPAKERVAETDGDGLPRKILEPLPPAAVVLSLRKRRRSNRLSFYFLLLLLILMEEIILVAPRSMYYQRNKAKEGRKETLFFRKLPHKPVVDVD